MNDHEFSGNKNAMIFEVTMLKLSAKYLKI